MHSDRRALCPLQIMREISRLAPCKFRQVLDCGCPSAAFGAADLVTYPGNQLLDERTLGVHVVFDASRPQTSERPRKFLSCCRSATYFTLSIEGAFGAVFSTS